MHRSTLICACLILGPAALPAQTARIAAPGTDLRAAPGAQPVATLLEGAEVRLGATRGEWREATLEAWIWAESVGPTDRDGHDLVVTSSGGENLRRTPNGARVARGLTGMLLSEVEREGNWIRVRRTGWIPQSALAAAAAPAPAASPVAARSRPDAAATSGSLARVGTDGAALLAAPDGDTLAAIRPATAVEVTARDGGWRRVRLVGWVWAPNLGAPTDSSGVLTDITPARLAESPETFRGRLIEWTVQFIALQRAEKIRSDFSEGEPFILARGPDTDPGFVYIAVPPDRLAEVEALRPLQRITVVARVRSARSPLMDAPVLDLVRLR
ncbi:MAG TPA: hypothetical protein VF188_02030 [Longimicrobiales bacterium]